MANVKDKKRSLNRVEILIWAAYFAFVGAALYLERAENPFNLSGPYGGVKLFLWVAYVCFVAYSIHCNTRAEFFSGLKNVAKLPWGRQAGVDLYLGFFLTGFIVYLNEGYWFATLLWIIPGLFYVNLITLLYFIIHFDALVAR